MRILLFIAVLMLGLCQGAPDSRASFVLMESFAGRACLDLPSVAYMQTLERQNPDVLILNCYTNGIYNLNSDVQDACLFRLGDYETHRGNMIARNPTVILNGLYDMAGTYPNLVRSGIKMVETYMHPQTISVNVLDRTLQASLPDLTDKQDLTLWFIAYNRQLALMELPEGAEIQHPDYILPEAGHDQNIVTYMKKLGPWAGTPESISIPLENFEADGYVIFAQAQNMGEIMAAGVYKSRSIQSGM